MKFCILHGSFNGPDERWLAWLKNELEALGLDVIFPKFPVEDWDVISEKGESYQCKKQNASIWLEKLRPLVDENSEYIIVGHSTGPAFSLHAIQEFNLNVKLAVWVAPFIEKLNKVWQTDIVNRSYVDISLLDMDKLRMLIKKSAVIYSDNDKYIDEKYSLNFANLFNSETFLVESGGHLNNSAGFNEFPLVLDIIKENLH